jgi:hypothetical protein
MITHAFCPVARNCGSINLISAITSLMCLHSGVPPLGD